MTELDLRRILRVLLTFLTRRANPPHPEAAVKSASILLKPAEMAKIYEKRLEDRPAWAPPPYSWQSYPRRPLGLIVLLRLACDQIFGLRVLTSTY
jgi:hypothetical protein